MPIAGDERRPGVGHLNRLVVDRIEEGDDLPLDFEGVRMKISPSSRLRTLAITVCVARRPIDEERGRPPPRAELIRTCC
jgi:hypothetical protein